MSRLTLAQAGTGSALLLAAALSSSAEAQARVEAPTFACSHESIVHVQNITSSPSRVEIRYHDGRGWFGSQQAEVPPGQSYTFPAPDLPPPFDGGFEGACFVWGAGIVIVRQPSGEGTTHYTYSGSEPFRPKQAVLLSLVMPPLSSARGGKASQIALQNVGRNRDGIEVQISCSASNGTPAGDARVKLGDQGAIVLDSRQLQLTGPSPHTCEAVSGSGALAGSLVNSHPGRRGDRTSLPAYGSYAETIYLPLVRRGTSSTEIQIQNGLAADHPVRVEYYDRAGSPVLTRDLSIGPRQTLSFTAADGQLPDGFDGTAVVTAADGSIVGTTTEVMDAGARGRSDFATSVPGYTEELATPERSWAVGPPDPERVSLTYRARNIGKARAWVRVTMRDGAGNVLAKRTLKIKANAIGEVEFPASDVQGAFSIETRVKKKGPVIALVLERRSSGELNFVPSLEPY